MKPIGYVVMQHVVRWDRPVHAYDKWMHRIPASHAGWLLQTIAPEALAVDNDPQCLASLKHDRSLMPMAQQARKPIFALKAADGALGGHVAAIKACFADFSSLADRIARAIA
jgi:hypothetical protein